jgi:hypothetical protein
MRRAEEAARPTAAAAPDAAPVASGDGRVVSLEARQAKQP